MHTVCSCLSVLIPHKHHIIPHCLLSAFHSTLPNCLLIHLSFFITQPVRLYSTCVSCCSLSSPSMWASTITPPSFPHTALPSHHHITLPKPSRVTYTFHRTRKTHICRVSFPCSLFFTAWILPPSTVVLLSHISLYSLPLPGHLLPRLSTCHTHQIYSCEGDRITHPTTARTTPLEVNRCSTDRNWRNVTDHQALARSETIHTVASGCASDSRLLFFPQPTAETLMILLKIM